MSQTARDISVIICAYTEVRWDNLIAAVASVQQQTFPPGEIILVIDHNPSLLKRVLDHIQGVVVVSNTEARGLSGARNSGIAAAKGQIIAFLDDDAVAAPDWLMLLSEGFTDPQVLGIGGAVTPHWLSSEPAWLPEEFHWVVGCTYRGMPQTTKTIRNSLGANMSFRRNIFAVVGGFRSEIGRIGTQPAGCEETELCIRVRQRWHQAVFLYRPQASVSHRISGYRASWQYFCSRCYCEGLSKAAITRYVGAKDSLSSERTYILRTLPQGVLRGVMDGLFHLDLAGFLRAGAIITGLLVTIAGYLVGTIPLWLKTNRVMLANAGSLVGTTAVTSALGFVYWWLAARLFPPEAVGIASASISAMMLLGSFCMLGLGTLLITELPRQPGQEVTLISTALIVVGGVGGCIGIVFTVVAPYASVDFQALRVNVADIVIFAAGVSLTAITLVLDQALIGVLRGTVQLRRNVPFAVAKLAVLFVVGLWLSHGRNGLGSPFGIEITLYATWAVGNVLSLAALGGFVMLKGGWLGRTCLPQWKLLRKLGPAALQHHLLNLILQAPPLALPVLVTVLLSAKTNAWFYISWMIASFVFFIPLALTMVLHAMNASKPFALAHTARVTISIAMVTSVLANCLLLAGTKHILGLFGSSYAEQAAWNLRILVLAAFPLIIKNHYISICRIQDRIAGAMLRIAPGSLLELGAAALGAHLGGLSGLSIGWVAGVYLESIFMFRTVYRVVRTVETYR